MMSPYISRIVNVIATFVLLASSIDSTSADEASVIARLASDFESARVRGDVKSGRELILAEATSLPANGGGSRLLLSELRGTARWLSRPQSPKPAETTVVSRRIVVRGDSAVVTELIRIDGRRPRAPQRRTLLWVRAEGSWKIAHSHASDYSRWEKSITAYEAKDKEAPSEKGGVVFVGSSSIRGWKTLAADFPDVNAIGRGFGGSEMIDSVLYANRIVTAYHPRAVAVYAGDNDIAAGKSAERVFKDFQLFVETVHKSLPKTRIGFIAIKPSISRWSLWSKMERANSLVAGFARQRKSVDYLDIATPMLGENGEPRKELFVKDGLHMTSKGYELWTSVVRPWVGTGEAH